MNQAPSGGYIALVVDDHEAVRRALCDFITASFPELEVRAAASAEEALGILDTNRVVLVVMDVELPGMDGISATRLVHERSPDTAVIVVSVFDDATHRAAARRAGARAYVCKRAIGRELVPALHALLGAPSPVQFPLARRALPGV